MPFRTRNIVSEFSTAMAVLSIYVLVLLAPWHQAAGLQRNFDQLGYAFVDDWSICAPLVQQDSPQPTVVPCAMTGIGKNELAVIEPVVLPVGIVPVASAVEYAETSAAGHPATDRCFGQPRAPPVMA